MTEGEPVEPTCRERQLHDLDGLVADFAAHIPEVLHAVVLSSDGVPLTGSDRMQGSVYADWVSDVASGLITFAHGAAGLSGYGAVTQALVAMEWGTLVIMAIDDAANLAVLTTAADLDMVAYAMTVLVEQAAGLTTSTARGLDTR
ncbi:MAG: roadblock/LC7 domain-containing protein [Streptosporangiaceae bacterium]